MAYIGVSPSNGVRQKHTYTATASQTTFSGAGSEGVSLSYRDSNYVDVYRNGVKLGDADYTATSGTSVVLGEGAAVSDIIEIVTYDVFSVADTVSKADGGTFDGNVTMAGTLDVTGAVTTGGNVGINESNPSSSLHIYGSTPKITLEHSNENGTAQIYTQSQSGIILDADPDNTDNGTPIQLKTDGKARLLVEDSGDISFYEDTGTTPKLFWDASAESLGIGTTTPSTLIHLEKGSTGAGGGSDAGITMTNKFDSPDNSWSITPQRTGVSNTGLQIRDETDSRTDMVFDGSGKVGIGISSPNTTLTTNSASEAVGISAQSTTTGSFIGFKDATSTNWYYNHVGAVGDNLKFTTGGAERMRILSGGQLVINATSLPVVGTEKLGVSGGGASNSVAIAGTCSHNTGIPLYLTNISNTTNTYIARFATGSGGSTRGEIYFNGSALVYATSSDYRLKQNINYDFDATTKLKQLKPAEYRWIEHQKDDIGFLAHEVQEVFPNAVGGEKDEVNADGSIKPQTYDPSKLVPLLVKTIQELEARIVALENA